jgi:hypothetical protein
MSGQESDAERPRPPRWGLVASRCAAGARDACRRTLSLRPWVCGWSTTPRVAGFLSGQPLKIGHMSRHHYVFSQADTEAITASEVATLRWLDGGQDARQVRHDLDPFVDTCDDEPVRPLPSGWYLHVGEPVNAVVRSGLGGPLAEVVEVWELDSDGCADAVFRFGRGRSDRDDAVRLATYLIGRVRPLVDAERERDRRTPEYFRGALAELSLALHAEETENTYGGVRRVLGVPAELTIAREATNLSKSELARRVASYLDRPLNPVRLQLSRFEAGRVPTLPVDVLDGVELILAEAERASRRA